MAENRFNPYGYTKSMVFKNNAFKVNGKTYVPGFYVNPFNDPDASSGYVLYTISENYDGKIRGGIRKSLRQCFPKLEYGTGHYHKVATLDDVLKEIERIKKRQK